MGLFLLAQPAQAAVRCETQYGGGTVCITTGALQINKKVWNPDSGSFVDNLGLNDRKFAPGDEITFRLYVKNVGDTRLNSVHITDTLPDFFTLVSGSLSYDLSNLDPNQTDEKEIKVKVVPASKLPGGQKIVCSNQTINTAEARSGDNSDKDTTQVCLERKVLGAKVLPVTGSSILPVFTLVLLLVAGLVLKIRTAK